MAKSTIADAIGAVIILGAIGLGVLFIGVVVLLEWIMENLIIVLVVVVVAIFFIRRKIEGAKQFPRGGI